MSFISKKSAISLLCAGVLAVGLAGCSSDDPTVEEPVTEPTQTQSPDVDLVAAGNAELQVFWEEYWQNCLDETDAYDRYQADCPNVRYLEDISNVDTVEWNLAEIEKPSIVLEQTNETDLNSFTVTPDQIDIDQEYTMLTSTGEVLKVEFDKELRVTANYDGDEFTFSVEVFTPEDAENSYPTPADAEASNFF